MRIQTLVLALAWQTDLKRAGLRNGEETES